MYIFWSFLFFLKYTQWQCFLSYDNSTAMYKFLKTLHPGGVVIVSAYRTEDPVFESRKNLCVCAITCIFLEKNIMIYVPLLDMLLWSKRSTVNRRRRDHFMDQEHGPCAIILHMSYSQSQNRKSHASQNRTSGNPTSQCTSGCYEKPSFPDSGFAN
jgi:hypothetical protein